VASLHFLGLKHPDYRLFLVCFCFDSICSEFNRSIAEYVSPLLFALFPQYSDPHSTPTWNGPNKQDVHRDGVHYVIAGTGGGLDLHDLIPQTDYDGSKVAAYPGLEFAEQSLGFAALTRIRTTGDLRLKLYRVRPGPSMAASNSTDAAVAAAAFSSQARRKLSDAIPLPNGNFLARFWWWLQMPRAPPPLPVAEAPSSASSGDEPEPIIEVIHSVTISSRRREWAAGGSR